MTSLQNFIDKVFKIDKYAILVKDGEVKASSGVQKLETQDSFIWLINPNNIFLDINQIESIDNNSTHVYNFYGVWACIIKCKHTSEIKAITSVHNEFPWYYSDNGEGIISNNLYLLQRSMLKSSIDIIAIASFLAFDFCFSDFTYLKEVKKTYGGDILYLSRRSIIIKNIDLSGWLKFDETLEDPKMILDAFLKSIDKSFENPKTQITLTSGGDSRAILAGAIHLNKKFELMTGTVSSVDPRDITIPRKIAKYLNVPHYEVDESKTNISDINKVLEEMSLMTSSGFLPRNWIIFYKEFILNMDILRTISRLQGYRGEFFKGFYNNISLMIRRKTFLLKNNIQMELENFISTKYKNYENIAGPSAKELFYHRERDNIWVSSNIRTTIGFCNIYTPFGDPELLKLAYRFKGGITNTKLHQQAISLLPTKIRKIPLRRSYIEYLFYKINQRLKNRSDFNYFLRADFIKGNLDWSILNQIFDHEKIESVLNKYAQRGNYDDIVHKMYAISLFSRIINQGTQK